MATSSDYPETPKEEDSHQAMLERRSLRLAGRLNPRIRPVGLANLVAQMIGSNKWYHPLDCICEWCLPTDMREMVLGLRRYQKPKSDPVPPVAPEKAFQQPKTKWTQQRGRSSN